MRNSPLATLQTGPAAAILLAAVSYRGRDRLDLRSYFVPPGETDMQPTRKGVSFSVEHAPILRAGLEEAERNALREGQLTAEAYERAGVAMPPGDLGSSTLAALTGR